MKYRFLIFIFLLFSCTPQLTIINQKQPYSAKGLAYIYNEYDFNERIIKGKMNNENLQISHQNLKTGTLLKITNPINKKSIVLKNIKRIQYPDFYKILITSAVSNELNLNIKLPVIEITEVKKNKSFIAEKAKIYKEEKKVKTKAPVATVQIANISKNKKSAIKKETNKIFIHIATFYSSNTAKFLKQRIIEEVKDLDSKKLKVQNINNKETQVISGPYTSINLLKNDYIKLKKYGFEELDIFIND